MSAPDLTQLVTITVTFHPDLEILKNQLAGLPSVCNKVVVDNTSDAEVSRALHGLEEEVPNLHLVTNAYNVGLAAAINQGARFSQERFPEAQYCLLLDQDSEPRSGSIVALWATMKALETRGARPGAVGPLLLDAETGVSHGFHQMTAWRWRRVYPVQGSQSPVPCSNLNGSGSLVPLDLFLQLNGLDENLFIDHVDTEWAFRVLAHGYSLWGVPNAVFEHRMGQATVCYWLFGWRIWPVRSVLRQKYLFRNTVCLMRRPYVPSVWKVWAMVKLTLTFAVHALFGPKRAAQISAMFKGLSEGLLQTKHIISDEKP